MRLFWLILCSSLLLGALAQYGCSRKVVEYDARLGKRVGGATGFWVYRTSLPPNREENVKVVVADRVTLEGRVEVFTPESHYVFPIVAYDPPRRYAAPEILKDCLPFNPSMLPDTVAVIELGYFMTNLTKLTGTNEIKWFLREPEEGSTAGVSWGIPTKRLTDLVADAVPKLLRVAADYGADAIIGLAVFSQGRPSTFGPAGLYMTGTVVAIDKRGRSRVAKDIMQQMRILGPFK